MIREYEESLRQFYADAFWRAFQEFTPETHMKNVDDLVTEYGWPQAVVDSMYRLACHFESQIKDEAESVFSRRTDKATALSNLDLSVYYYFNRDLKEKALDLTIDFFENLAESRTMPSSESSETLDR